MNIAKFLEAAFCIERTTLVAASGEVSKTVKPDGMILSVKIDCLNPISVNAAMLK